MSGANSSLEAVLATLGFPLVIPASFSYATGLSFSEIT